MDVRAAAAVVDVRAPAGGRGRRLWTAAVVDGGEGVAREKEREREGGHIACLSPWPVPSDARAFGFAQGGKQLSS